MFADGERQEVNRCMAQPCKRFDTLRTDARNAV